MEEITIIGHVSELCATNATAADLCRSLVHSEVTGEDAVGAAVFLTTLAGDLDLIGSFGRVPELGDDKSIWADNPLAGSIRGHAPGFGKMKNGNGDEFWVGALKILKGTSPIGVIAMMRTKQDSLIAPKLSEPAQATVGNTLGIWVDSLGVRPTTGQIDVQSNGELTSRQLEILRQMAAGKTNAQIASNLILSESSIRQETVKIYRALGVGTRAEAARKGLNLGLIDKAVTH